MGAALTYWVRITPWLIGLVLLVELAILPWTAHAYDASAFLSHTERVYFGHVRLAALWSFGSISLAVLLVSQLPVLFFPQLWNALPLRIFLLKLPAWFADLGSAAVIRACSADPRFGNGWALRYLLDPAVVFVTVLHGQADALPNFFAVAGIALTLAEKYELAGLAFGLGVGTKFYPAAFVPLLAAVAYRRDSWQRALRAVAAFGAIAAITLLPILWGRADAVMGAYLNNSFGPESVGVSTTSLWSLMRGRWFSPAPQFEQFVAVAIPVLLAAWELRHLPDRRDVARTAMFTAMSIVLLNPGAHPPFYLWIAGPLVLYAAVADDGFVSLAGFGLSCMSFLTQFCQEGSDEYFRLNFGPGQTMGLLRCVAPLAALQSGALVLAVVIVVASCRRSISTQAARLYGAAAQVVALLFFATFGSAIAAETVSAARTHTNQAMGYRAFEQTVNTFAINPIVRQIRGGCVLIYATNDVLVYAGNPFAARFATASLGYTLFLPEEMTVRDRTIPIASLPSRYEDIDIRTIEQRPIRITREFDVSDQLRPFRAVERFVERPCTLVPSNPLLIYRFNFAAAHAAAARTPLFERLNVFARAHG